MFDFDQFLKIKNFQILILPILQLYTFLRDQNFNFSQNSLFKIARLAFSKSTFYIWVTVFTSPILPCCCRNPYHNLQKYVYTFPLSPLLQIKLQTCQLTWHLQHQQQTHVVFQSLLQQCADERDYSKKEWFTDDFPSGMSDKFQVLPRLELDLPLLAAWSAGSHQRKRERTRYPTENLSGVNLCQRKGRWNLSNSEFIDGVTAKAN